MINMKPVLDFFIDANIVFLVTFGLWALVQFAISRSAARFDYAAQLRLLRVVMAVLVLSPLLALGVTLLGQRFWPETPTTLSDLAVAAYLNGSIALPAMEFEALLYSRSRLYETLTNGGFLWLPVLSAMLIIGAVIHAAMAIRAALHVRRAVDASYLWRRTRTTDIRLSDRVTIPFAARGLRRRHVVLPSDILTRPRDLRLVLAHEFQHLRQGDVEWELLFEFLRPLLFWNPVFVIWRRSFERLREFSCDQSVLNAGWVSPRAYADCLLRFCERRICAPLPRAVNVAFVRNRSHAARRALETRVLALRTSRLRTRAGLILPVLAVMLSVGVVAAATSVRQPADWSQDRLMLSTIVNLERLEAINRGF